MLKYINNKWLNRSVARLPHRIMILCSMFWMFFLTTGQIFAQADIELHDVVVGKVEVVATNSITLKPGFHAVEGSYFHAVIGSAQAQNSSTTITSPSDDTTPVEGTYGMNYIQSITYSEPYTSVPTGSYRHTEDVQYLDGLGRPVQTISIGASPAGNDIILPVLYDDFGREAVKTLPYTASKSGAFRTGVTEATVNTYYSNDTPENKESDSRAYTSFVFDNSPLNRVVSQTGPGSDWETNNKSVFTNYLTNTSTEPGWSVIGNYSYTTSNYSANTLFVIEIEDEEGNITHEYKDKLGRVVLKKSKLDGVWLRTAYIYDDFGLLRCVVPPEADGTSDINLCYYYLYDSHQRMIEKKIPGGGIIKMVYDKRDRLRFTQNSEQDKADEWSFIKYDPLNRPAISGTVIYTGNVKTAVDAASMNETCNDVSGTFGYTSNSFPATGGTILTATYYDNYTFISGMDLNDSLNLSTFDASPYVFASVYDNTPKGMVTGTMTKVLSDQADNGCVPLSTLYSTFYYTKYGHLLRTISENHLNGKDVVSNIYEDITYRILQSKQEHYTGSEEIVLEKWFEYDHTGRLLATKEKINEQDAITLNALEYNEVGELIHKYMHSNQTSGTRSFIQKTDYQYNIRGWLTKINDPALGDENDMFGMQLFYNNTSGMGNLAPTTGLYNGNIVGMKWGINDEHVRGYKFSYDDLNRLLQGIYAEGSTLNSNTGYNTETITGYDKNGNITGLQRKINNSLVDALTYNYTIKTNKISSIADNGSSTILIDDYPGTSGTYTYDANGNMSFDGAKNITIEYFPTLNLPKDLYFGNNNRIYYHYTATGNKLIKHNYEEGQSSGILHYIENIVYEGGTLSYILTEEGRLVPFGTGSERIFVNEYNLRDHLGNNRVTFMGTDLGGAVDIVQKTSYYPFGLVMSQTNGNTDPTYQKNRYLYNGKEHQDDEFAGSSLNWYDYGARFYDAQIARWHTVDPAAESMNSWSPYNYTFNNPVRFIDPDGTVPDDFYFTKKGELIAYIENDESDRVFIAKDDQQIYDNLGNTTEKDYNQVEMSSEKVEQKMNDNGYKKVMKEEVVIETDYSNDAPGCDGKIRNIGSWKTKEATLSINETYVMSDYNLVRTEINPLKKINEGGSYPGISTYTERRRKTYTYGHNPAKKPNKKFLNRSVHEWLSFALDIISSLK